MSSPRFRRTRHLLAVAIAATAAGAAASTASAGVLVASASSCEDQPLSQPFTPWLDHAWYTPAPNGTLEAGASQWDVEDASVVADNEPWQVAGANDSRALQIEPGGSATTRAMCVGLEHPTLRFFARRTSSGILASLASLRVDVLYENHLGLVETLPIGTVKAGTSWDVTPVQVVVANLLPLLPGARTPVAFRFTPQGASGFRIDDVFVDPYRTG